MEERRLFNPLVCVRKDGENYMTVGEVKQFLQNYNDDDILIISKDAEGNDYSPLDGIEESIYYPNTTYSGEKIHLEDEDLDNIKENINTGKYRNCIIIFPIN